MTGRIKIGSLVRPVPGTDDCGFESPYLSHRSPKYWLGIVVGYDGADPVVFWGKEFPDEVEYEYQLELIQ